jgi:hypothetical protein
MGEVVRAESCAPSGLISNVRGFANFQIVSCMVFLAVAIHETVAGSDFASGKSADLSG